MLISYAKKVMLKTLQAKFQQYVNQEFPDVQSLFIKVKGTKNQTTNIHWMMEKVREFKGKKIYFCLTDYAKTFDCVDHN